MIKQLIITLATITLAARAFDEFIMPESPKDNYWSDLLEAPFANNITVTPEPGGFTASLKVSSLNHAMEYALKLGVSEALKNKTFDINWSKHGLFKYYDAYINSFTIETIDNWEVTNLDFVGKTNTLAIDISGVNVNTTVDGGVTCLWLIPVTV